MSKHGTAIEWTHIPGFKGETWNPIVGCDIVSKGCTNCYAMKWAAQRLDGNKNSPHYAGTTTVVNSNRVWTGKIAKASEKTLQKPLRWSKPRSIFVNSMGDLFHESVPDEWIDQVFAIAALCPQHIFIILTKRAERMQDYVSQLPYDGWTSKKNYRVGDKIKKFSDHVPAMIAIGTMVSGPLKNVWLGVSAEDQATANERISYLTGTPAAVRFVSCEPLLGEINLKDIQFYDGSIDALSEGAWGEEIENWKASEDPTWKEDFLDWFNLCTIPDPKEMMWNKLDWVIAGGESGPNARPMHPDWARSLRDQCLDAGVPFFFKQWGEWVSVYDRDIDDPDWRNSPKAKNNKERYINLEGGHGFHGERVNFIKKVGKKKAGHILDGVEHFNWPECVNILEGVE